MLQHTSSEVIIFRLQINLNSKNTTHCTDWELTKLIDIKRQEYAKKPFTSKMNKYLTIAKHSSFVVVIRTCSLQVQLKPSFWKLFPFLLKDLARVFGGIRSRDLICINSTSEK